MIIPKAVRDRQGWQPGEQLEVEDRGDVVVRRRPKPFLPTTIEEAYGHLKYEGRPATIREMRGCMVRLLTKGGEPRAYPPRLARLSQSSELRTLNHA